MFSIGRVRPGVWFGRGIEGKPVWNCSALLLKHHDFGMFFVSGSHHWPFFSRVCSQAPRSRFRLRRGLLAGAMECQGPTLGPQFQLVLASKRDSFLADPNSQKILPGLQILNLMEDFERKNQRLGTQVALPGPESHLRVRGKGPAFHFQKVVLPVDVPSKPKGALKKQRQVSPT